MSQPNKLAARSSGYRTSAIEIDRALILALRPEAARRGTTVARLIHELLDVIAADQLTTAILDQ